MRHSKILLSIFYLLFFAALAFGRGDYYKGAQTPAGGAPAYCDNTLFCYQEDAIAWDSEVSVTDDCDGFLSIGNDPLLNKTPDGFQAIDLAAAWRAATELPFVFAIFAAKKNSQEFNDLEKILGASHSWARDHIDTIAYDMKNTIAPNLLKRYLNTLTYIQNDSHKKSLSLFFSLSKECL